MALKVDDLKNRVNQNLLYIRRIEHKFHGYHIVECKRCHKQSSRSAQNLYRPCGYCTNKILISDLQNRCHSTIKYIKYLGKSLHQVECKSCGDVFSRSANNLKRAHIKCHKGLGYGGLSDVELKARTHNNIEIIGRTNHSRGGQIKVKCMKCGLTKLRRADLLHQACRCSAKFYESKAEKELRSFIESLGFQTEKWHIQRKEFDIKIESKKLLIEYNGLYWHSEKVLSKKRHNPKKYHLEKLKLANSLGYRLITIFEDEWLFRKPQVKNFLKSVLGVHCRKIFARKCIIKAMELKDADVFLDQNHIQGKSASRKKAAGLFYDNELVAAMTLGVHHRNFNVLTLDRFAIKNGFSIVGGASKLLNFLKFWAKEQKYDKIISWSDNRWSEGNVYSKLGFSLESELPPDYSYINGRPGYRKTKQSMKKTSKERLTKKTEFELRSQQGYYRIWDCGKKRWVFYVNS